MTERRAMADLITEDAATRRALGEVAEQLMARVAPSGAPKPQTGYRRLLEEALASAAEAQAQALSAMREADRLRALSQRDEVTGLLNRRGFNAAHDAAMQRAVRHGEHGLIVLIDLDGFKAINDTHGHAAGDFLLSVVATMLRHHLRATDVIARLGGDEFGVILTHADDDGEARRRLRKLTRALSEVAVPWNGRTLTLSASLGAVPYGPEDDPAAVLHAADQAMYRVKRDRKATRIGGRMVH